MRKKKIGFMSKGLIVISIFVIIIYIITGYVLVTQMKNSLMEMIQERMLDISNTAAASLDGDILKDFRREDYGTPRFNEVNKTLNIYQDNMGLKFIYFLRRNPEGEYYIAAGPSMETEDEFGLIVEGTPVMDNAMKGHAGAENEATTDQWGSFYSAFSPVYDSNNEVVGIVGVDFDAEWFDNRVGKFEISLVNIGILSIIMGGLGVLSFSAGLIRKMRSLNEQLNDLGDSVDDLTAMLSEDENVTDTQVDESHYVDDKEVNDMQIISDRIRLMKSGVERYINHISAQAFSMISALSENYRAVCYIDLDADDGICYRPHNMIEGTFKEGEHFPYREIFEGYAYKYVESSFREGYLDFVNIDNIKRRLQEESVLTHLYMVEFGEVATYELMKIARVRLPEEDGSGIHAISVGLTDVDSETRKTLAHSKALSEALAIAEEANKAKTAFLSSMSHEIRTPMNAIISYDHMALSKEGVPDEVVDYLHKIDESADHLLKIINNILDMSRMEAGHSALEETEFSLSEELRFVNDLTIRYCREKDLKFEFEMDSDADGKYLGDVVKFKQIIINILGNAVKFTKEGSIFFKAEKVVDFDDKSTLKFVIRDTGVGMDRSFLPKIFDSFSQEDCTNKTKYGSTGLGMAIAKNLADVMNGKIEVDSEKGRGTTFTVTITFTRVGEVQAAAAEEDAGDISLSGRRVLIAEDMDINAEIIEMILSEEDMESERAVNGKVAVEMFDSKAPGYYDLVLMDIRMPEMDGLEAASAIRDLDRPDAARIPIIALTANAFDEDVERSLQAGMNAHLTKPVVPEVLFENIKKYLRSANG